LITDHSFQITYSLQVSPLNGTSEHWLNRWLSVNASHSQHSSHPYVICHARCSRYT